jgi:hypothetical protein
VRSGCPSGFRAPSASPARATIVSRYVSNLCRVCSSTFARVRGPHWGGGGGGRSVDEGIPVF